MQTPSAKFLLSTVVTLLALNTATAFAENRPREPGVNARQHIQKDRIQQGVRTGSLTRDEAKELRKGQREIRQQEREYRSDGEMTREERKELHKELNEQSRAIYQQKHDAETR